jgi:hypothetical protein
MACSNNSKSTSNKACVIPSYFAKHAAANEASADTGIIDAATLQTLFTHWAAAGPAKKHHWTHALLGLKAHTALQCGVFQLTPDVHLNEALKVLEFSISVKCGTKYKAVVVKHRFSCGWASHQSDIHATISKNIFIL